MGLDGVPGVLISGQCASGQPPSGISYVSRVCTKVTCVCVCARPVPSEKCVAGGVKEAWRVTRNIVVIMCAPLSGRRARSRPGTADNETTHGTRGVSCAKHVSRVCSHAMTQALGRSHWHWPERSLQYTGRPDCGSTDAYQPAGSGRACRGYPPCSGDGGSHWHTPDC